MANLIWGKKEVERFLAEGDPENPEITPKGDENETLKIKVDGMKDNRELDSNRQLTLGDDKEKKIDDENKEKKEGSHKNSEEDSEEHKVDDSQLDGSQLDGSKKSDFLEIPDDDDAKVLTIKQTLPKNEALASDMTMESHANMLKNEASEPLKTKEDSI